MKKTNPNPNPSSASAPASSDGKRDGETANVAAAADSAAATAGGGGAAAAAGARGTSNMDLNHQHQHQHQHQHLMHDHHNPNIPNIAMNTPHNTLSGLFAPPPPPPSSSSSASHPQQQQQRQQQQQQQQQQPLALASLFAPPPPPPSPSILLPPAQPPAASTTSSSSMSTQAGISTSTPFSINPLSSLFAPPPPPPPPPTTNATTAVTERTSLLGGAREYLPAYYDVSGNTPTNDGDGEGAFAALQHQQQQQQQHHQQHQHQQQQQHKTKNNHVLQLQIPPQQQQQQQKSFLQSTVSVLQPSTIVGSLLFVFYHVVFVLAFASAILRPHSSTTNGSSSSSSTSILGAIAKMVAVGIMGAGPLYIYRLNQDIPAVYPSVDLFLAPFLAQAAAMIDESLYEQQQQYQQQQQQHDHDDGASSTLLSSSSSPSYPNDAIFLGTFAVLTSIGMGLAAIFLWLGSTFKLANLGTYLPYSVLSGFFSAVGVLLWCLAFSVDTSGRTWKQVFLSGRDGDWHIIGNAWIHHAPSLILGIIMNRLGPKNPFYVILLIFVAIGGFYAMLWIMGMTLKDAQQAGWAWSLEELVYTAPEDNEEAEDLSTSNFVNVPAWMLPPAPLGSWAALLAGNVNFQAVAAGIPNMIALAFLYLLRSSIHASAMKKNVSNLVRRIPIKKEERTTTTSSSTNDVHLHDHDQLDHPEDEDFDDNDTDNESHYYRHHSTMMERVTESVRIVNMSMEDKKPMHSTRQQNGTTTTALSPPPPDYIEIRARTPRRSLESIFSEYSYALFVVAGLGGFGVCPTVATSNTMFAIGVEGAAPQYGSILLLIVFYLLDFRMVQYIPKMAFSSLLVLGAVDTMVVWFFGAFRKTQDLAEWLVVPFIAGFSLFVGFLNAVFLGIAISMFVFVASFFRVGVVKYSASGLEIRSRIERSMMESTWLNENGDLCQVLVLQNYLFFGNAISILNYIATMFEEVDESQSQRLDFSLPPIPNILVLDLSLVSGMDTSTIDIFAEIYQFCQNNDCKLFICGMSVRMKKGLELGGVQPDRKGPRSQSSLRFFSDLDTALGRAEDTLIRTQMHKSEPTTRRGMRTIKSTESLDAGGLGFRRALKEIDELHGLDFTLSLMDFQPYTKAIDLEPGDILYKCDGGIVDEAERGLFFIEEGMLKIERDSTQSLTATRSSIGSQQQQQQDGSHQYTLKNQHARMGSVARRSALARGGKHPSTSGNLRLARLGPGWICGTLDFGAGIRSSGITVAVTRSRLHLLPFHVLAQIEKDDPVLVLSLYKLVTHLRAYREEATIEQLTTLNNILTSPAHSKPISRAALRAMGP